MSEKNADSSSPPRNVSTICLISLSIRFLLSPDFDQLFRLDDVGEALNALQRGVVAVFGIGTDAIADDDHQVAAVVTIAHGHLDAAVGGAADHDHRRHAAIVY